MRKQNNKQLFENSNMEFAFETLKKKHCPMDW